jgi:hypothetical protein
LKIYTLFIVILFFNLNSSFAQDTDAILKKVEEVGYQFVAPLKNGKIAHLKNRKPPKNTWTYEALLQYKKQLDAGEFVFYGSYISPTKKKGFYNFNFYATKESKEGERYFFTTSVIISLVNDKYKVIASFMFTEKESLKAWWLSTVNFFRSDDFNTIPKEFIQPNICPPPPNF